MKASSKRVPQDRKRRKIDLLGTFEQFQAQQEEQKQEESEAQAEESAFADHENSQVVPNVIGNAEDEVNVQNEAS